MQFVSLWESNSSDVKVEHKSSSIKEEKYVSIEEPKNEDAHSNLSETKKYVVLADKNKYNRQLYLCGYDDYKGWFISVVPFETTYENAQRLIKNATKEINKLGNIGTFGRIREMPDFKIVEFTVS